MPYQSVHVAGPNPGILRPVKVQTFDRPIKPTTVGFSVFFIMFNTRLPEEAAANSAQNEGSILKTSYSLKQ